MGLSIRAYARHRGVSHVAVKKAIDSGRITPEAGWHDRTKSGRPGVGTKHGVGQETRLGEGCTCRCIRTVARTRNGASGTGSPGVLSTGGTSLLQARTVNEVVKAQTNKVRLAQLKGDLVDRSQAIAHVFRLARTERDAWLNWPARISAQMAAKLEIDAHELHVALESAVRDHLIELGELRARVD
jgi:hypothetical protein